MRQTCSKCHKPKEIPGSGLVTRLIELCQCDNLRAEQSETITFCQICSKRIAKNEGSMTQWVFGREKCECERPAPNETPVEKLISPSFVGFREAEDEIELELDADKFPVERYKALLELGHGAAGRVYLARDKLLGKKVAIKTLHELTPEQLVSFQDEARATAKLEHPNIVKILDFGASDSGTPYMVMEYVPGISLEKYMAERGVLDEPIARQVFSKLADALKYAHSQSVFHRDLKPSNIILYESDDELQVCLIDFGVARVKEATGMVTTYQSKTLAGTPSYMSPDPINGEVYDERSEIYCLGCVLFEALAGRPSFEGDTALETLSMHAHEEPPNLGSFDLGLSKDIAEIVSICLRKEKGRRFESMESLLARMTTTSTSEQINLEKQQKVNSLWYLIWCAPVVVILAAVFLLSTGESSRKKQIEPVKGKSAEKNKIKILNRAALEKQIQESLGSIDLRGFDLTENALSPLGNGPVRDITIENCILDSSSFEYIARLKHLLTLDIYKSKFKTDDFQRLENLPELTGLNLEHDQFDDKLALSISKMAKLRTLTYTGVKGNESSITEKGLEGWQKLDDLTSLNIENVHLLDGNFNSIANIKNLTLLRLLKTGVTRENIESLVRLQKLDFLSIGGECIDKELTSSICKLPKLRFLTIYDSEVVYADFLKDVLQIKSLRSLSLKESKFAEQRLFTNKPAQEFDYILLESTSKKVSENWRNLKLYQLSVCDVNDFTAEDMRKLFQNNAIERIRVSLCKNVYNGIYVFKNGSVEKVKPSNEEPDTDPTMKILLIEDAPGTKRGTKSQSRVKR